MTGGFPGGASGQEPACQCRRRKRHTFDPCVGKIPWKRKWQPTLVFWPGKSHGQRTLAGYSPWGSQRVGHNWSNLACMHDWQITIIYINAKEYSNYCTITLISHASKVMLKILQARLQQYVNRELPDVQAGFRKGRGTRDQIANIRWIMEKARVPEKHLLLLYWLCQSLWLCGSQ